MKTSPVSNACSRRTAARWCRSCGRRSMRPTTAPISRSSSPISTRSIPGTPARTASSSSGSCANTATRCKSSAASPRSTNRGFTPVDESLLQQMGEDALGAITGNWYSAELDFPINKKFVESIRRDYKTDPGVYAAETYLCGEVLDHALKTIGGKAEDKEAFIKALRDAKVPNTLRGPVRFDELGNVVGNIYLRKVEKKD